MKLPIDTFSRPEVEVEWYHAIASMAYISSAKKKKKTHSMSQSADALATYGGCNRTLQIFRDMVELILTHLQVLFSYCGLYEV